MPRSRTPRRPRAPLKNLRSGHGADLLMIDVRISIADFIEQLDAEHIHIPIVACGIEHDADAAVAAIQAGAKEYIPFPPEPEIDRGYSRSRRDGGARAGSPRRKDDRRTAPRRSNRRIGCKHSNHGRIWDR